MLYHSKYRSLEETFVAFIEIYSVLGLVFKIIMRGSEAYHK